MKRMQRQHGRHSFCLEILHSLQSRNNMNINKTAQIFNSHTPAHTHTLTHTHTHTHTQTGRPSPIPAQHHGHVHSALTQPYTEQQTGLSLSTHTTTTEGSRQAFHSALTQPLHRAADGPFTQHSHNHYTEQQT